MRFTIADLAGDEVRRETMGRWIAHLIVKKKFKKKSVGYGFTENEAKDICELLSLDYNEISEKKKNQRSR